MGAPSSIQAYTRWVISQQAKGTEPFNKAAGTNYDAILVVEPKDPKPPLNELPDRMFFIDRVGYIIRKKSRTPWILCNAIQQGQNGQAILFQVEWNLIQKFRKLGRSINLPNTLPDDC